MDTAVALPYRVLARGTRTPEDVLSERVEYLTFQITKFGPDWSSLKEYEHHINRQPDLYHKLRNLLIDHNGGLDPNELSKFLRGEESVLAGVKFERECRYPIQETP